MAGTTGSGKISVGGGPGLTEESFKSGGNGEVSNCSNVGRNVGGGDGGASFRGGDDGLGIAIAGCLGGCCGLSTSNGRGGSGFGGAMTTGGGGGEVTTVAETCTGGGSGIVGAATIGGDGAISATGEGGVGACSVGGGSVIFGGAGAGGALSATRGVGEGGLGGRIWVRNSVNEACLDAFAWTGEDSGEIGSSNLSSQRRIWSRECVGKPANSSAATWPPSSRRRTMASPSIRADVSSANEKGIFSDGRRGIIARRENPCSERSRIIPPLEGGSST